MLPSQYPTTTHSSHPQAHHKPPASPSSQVQSKNKNHVRSTSHPKSFNAFLKDTNDEWSDDIHVSKISTTKLKPIESEQRSPPPPLLPKQTEVALSVVTPTMRKKKSSNGIKDHVQDILLDPTFLLNWLDMEDTREPSRTKKFKEVLCVSNVDLVALRSLSWSGIPEELRMMAWQLLLGYLPCNSARREITLARKRKEYSDSVTATYARGTAGLDQALWHQIHIDIPRTNPGIPLYQYEATQLVSVLCMYIAIYIYIFIESGILNLLQCLERILYQWAIRHPASGYVQGINDLVTPIFEVFLSAYIDEDPEQYDVSQLDKHVLSVIEADSFWCLSKLLDGIQDNYTFAQPGIQRQILTLKELVTRIDGKSAEKLCKYEKVG